MYHEDFGLAILKYFGYGVLMGPESEQSDPSAGVQPDVLPTPITAADVTGRLPTGYLVFDRSFRLDDLNNTAERLLNIDAAEVLGRHIKQVLAAHPSLPVLFQRSLLVQQEFVADVSVGDETLEVTYQPLFDADVQRTYRGSLVFLYDVTARRRSERTLAALANERQKLLEEREEQDKRLDAMSDRLATLQEVEQRTANQALHGEMSQALQAVTAELDRLAANHRGDGADETAELRHHVGLLAKYLQRLTADHSAEQDPPLTPRESEVLALAGDGLTSKDIADRLGLSKRTIDAHRASIKRKLGLRSKADWEAHGHPNPKGKPGTSG